MDMNKGQYSYSLSKEYRSEYHINMNKGSKAMLGEPYGMRHHVITQHKAIDSTSRTEIRDDIGPEIDVNKNFSRLPKIHQDPQPNNAGEPVARTLYSKGTKAGTAKGGINYGKR